ncbi:non-specific lipid-transfer protein-like [Cynara cardunculus var. scolymus]|uniref:non-specific lipid-transfer protein-like n=1 Tax=Cynara cardunculus var. scolymus TaxID=59895 RepID=UPI000D630B44|nr:non-specific lipid-transfer protein-like [Cynara cardunculus var. scolymus]
MVRNAIPIILMLVSVLLLSKQRATAQIDCRIVISKLINCESFLFGYSPVPSPDCCASTQDLVQAANASKDVLKATCRCLKSAVQAFPVNLSNAAQIAPLCHLNLNIPIDPSINCDLL